MRVFEALAAADASVAWTVMIGGGAWCDLVGLPRPVFDELFPVGRDVIVAGAFNPTGTCTAVDGGYRVTGRWGFASGCQHADVIYGNCIEGIVDGQPQLRIVVFSPEQVEIEDTWNVSGLSGTGSHHFRVDDLFVPADRTWAPFVDEPNIDAPIVHIPPPSLIPFCDRQCRDRNRSVARSTTSSSWHATRCRCSPTLRSPPTRCSSSSWRRPTPSCAPLEDCCTRPQRRCGESAIEGSPLTLDQRARIRATAVWATERAAAVTAMAYRWGGGTSIYAESPLQRRLRDIDALGQHFLVKRDTLTTAGAILAGEDVDVMVF